MTDGISLLKADHAKVKALFKECEALGNGAHSSRRKIFEQIDRELSLHALVEEKIFYPAFKAKTKSASDERDEVLEAYEEHACVKDLIAKLEALDPSDETYKAKIQVLSELVTHHVHEEETVLFKEARELLSKDELVTLGEQITEMKAEQSALA